MDKDFEKKVKNKKMHKMMAFAITAAIIAVIVLGTRIEWGDSLQEQDAEGGKMIEVSLEVRCDVLSGDLSKLKKAEKESYVPSDGVILEETVVEVSEDSSVYDVLYQVCKEQDIHMEASYTPGTEKAYVEGIQYLYEFDAGQMSGWMYFVNGNEADCGSSEYVLKEGDRILWAYTCNRGKDL